MRKLIQISLLSAGLLLNACSNQAQTSGQTTETNLNVKAYYEQLKTTPEAVVLDVRTAEEFADGHLENAINIDWTDSEFESQSATIDKSKPVYVYCLSGARSAEAADFLRSKGFKSVYNMDGGIMAWRAAKLPMTGTAEKVTGMSMEQYNLLIQSDKIVLVDFYADWCAPCKKMAPYLTEIAKEQAGKVELVRIDADAHPELCQALGVDALPTLKVYKKGKQTWSNVGYIEKESVLKQIQ